MIAGKSAATQVQEAVQNLRNYNCQYGMFWYMPSLFFISSDEVVA